MPPLTKAHWYSKWALVIFLKIRFHLVKFRWIQLDLVLYNHKNTLIVY